MVSDPALGLYPNPVSGHSPWLLTHAHGDAVNQQGWQIVEQNHEYRVQDRRFGGEKTAVPDVGKMKEGLA